MVNGVWVRVQGLEKTRVSQDRVNGQAPDINKGCRI